MESLINNRRGVFGLDTTKLFFSALLALAIFGFVIVVIMGTLNDSGVAGRDTIEGNFINETTNLTDSTLGGNAPATVANKLKVVLSDIIVLNQTGTVISPGNYSISNGVFTSITPQFNSTDVDITAHFTHDSDVVRTQDITANVSAGVSGFFAELTPVFSVLAVIIIILILIVLVRIVGGRKEDGL